MFLQISFFGRLDFLRQQQHQWQCVVDLIPEYNVAIGSDGHRFACNEIICDYAVSTQFGALQSLTSECRQKISQRYSILRE